MIEVLQVCDGCGAKRGLNHMHEAEYGGWRPMERNLAITTAKWLCPACIKKATAGAFAPRGDE
jgi:hypothetical protein